MQARRFLKKYLSGTATTHAESEPFEAREKPIAWHITSARRVGTQKLMVAALRYYDTFVKADGAWLFAERLLYVDRLENRILS